MEIQPRNAWFAACAILTVTITATVLMDLDHDSADPQAVVSPRAGQSGESYPVQVDQVGDTITNSEWEILVPEENHKRGARVVTPSPTPATGTYTPEQAEPSETP